MLWHYVENGQRKGPVEDAEMQQLAAVGTVSSQTLVWHSGMANWQAYGELAAQPFPSISPHHAETAETFNGAYCSQCGSSFAIEDMIRFEGAYICATCKPAFFQRIKEGSRLSTARQYAGFKIRLGAKLIDGVIIWVVQMAFALLIGVLWLRDASSGHTSMAIAAQILIMVSQVLVGAIYTCWFLVKFGATPGKMACRLKVITPEAESVSLGRALGRHFAEMLSGMILLIGYIMAAFDEEKRALHDRICNTRVVRA
ncbi:MAG TPA: RDD family protein [Terriglobia bacterium]|nr:RDD family protein [Terriglobia bacterium]